MQVDACAVNKYWGMGKPDYTKMKVPQDETGQFDSILSQIR
jgi:hypothetical protein